jgi:hypothetical protein
MPFSIEFTDGTFPIAETTLYSHHSLCVHFCNFRKRGLYVTMTADVEASSAHFDREIPFILSRAALRKKLQIRVEPKSIEGNGKSMIVSPFDVIVGISQNQTA